MSWKAAPVDERQGPRLLPQGLVSIAVDTGFLQTPGEAAHSTGGPSGP